MKVGDCVTVETGGDAVTGTFAGYRVLSENVLITLERGNDGFGPLTFEAYLDDITGISTVSKYTKKATIRPSKIGVPR